MVTNGKSVIVAIDGLQRHLIVRRFGKLNLETLTLGLILMTGCVVGFFKLLDLQDKWFNKMARGDGGLVI